MFCVWIPIAYCRKIHELQKMLERDLLQAYCACVWEKYALIVAGSRNFHDCFLAFNFAATFCMVLWEARRASTF